MHNLTLIQIRSVCFPYDSSGPVEARTPTLIVFHPLYLFFPEQAAVINNEPKTQQPVNIVFSHLRFHRHCDPPHTLLSDRIKHAKIPVRNHD